MFSSKIFVDGQRRWKELTVYVIKTCSSFGNLKMDATEGVQSFNFEVGQKLISHLEPELYSGT
jgi:hypothetical protein